MFYESVEASAMFLAVVCRGSGLKEADANRLNKRICKAASVVGLELDSLTFVSERRMLSKLLAILDNNSHPFHNVVDRYRVRSVKNLFFLTFVYQTL